MWEPKNKSDKLEDLMAEGTVSPDIFYDPNVHFPTLSKEERTKAVRKDKNAKKKALLTLLEGFSPKPMRDHPSVYEVKAPVHEFIKWAKSKDVGDVFLMPVKNAVNLDNKRLKNWCKTNQVVTMKIELVSIKKYKKFKNTSMDIWSVKASSYKIAYRKIKTYFNKYYAQDYTGRIIGYSIFDTDTLDRIKHGSVQALWSDTYCLLDTILNNDDFTQRVKENEFWGLPLTL